MDVRRDEQLDNETFDLDDILREFGSQAEPAPEPVPEPATVPEPEPAPAPPGKPKRPVKAPKPVREKPRQEARPKPERKPKPERQPRPKPEPRPEPEDLSPEELLQQWEARRRRRGAEATFSWLLLLLSAVVTVLACHPGWPGSSYVAQPAANIVLLGVLVCHILLAIPTLLPGITGLAKGRFSPQTLLTLAAVVAAIQSVRDLGADACSYAGVASALLTVAVWSGRLRLTADCRTLRTTLSKPDPDAVVRRENAVPGKAGLWRGSGDAVKLAEDLKKPTGPDRAMAALCPVLAAASLALAIVLAARGRDFLWTWCLLLLGSCPLGGLPAYARTFCRLSGRLQRAGAAVAGWAGACVLSGPVCAAVTDEDLLTGRSVVMNGMKVYGVYTPDRLLSYAAGLLEQAGAGSAKLFLDAAAAHGASRRYPSGFRIYDAGGLGGEFGGDVVLLGSASFLRDMGIPLPEDARLKQAVYIAVNGETAGVIALHCRPSESVRNALAALLGSRGVTPLLATRDVLLTPEMLRSVYHLPTDRMHYPAGADRWALSEVPTGKTEQGAVLTGGSLLSFAAAVSGARQMRFSARAAVWIGAASAFLGLGLTALLALLGAAEAANASNLLLYHLLWLIPAGMFTGLFVK